MGKPNTRQFLSGFLIGFRGTELPKQVADMLSKGLAGVVLFARNIKSPEQVRALTDQVRRAGGQDRIIAVDQEGGLVQRLRDIGTNIPSAAEVAAMGPESLGEIYRLMAREIAGLGFNLDFAPVLDVRVDTGHPIIGDRAFSRDPFVCAAMGTRMIDALHSQGVMACAKHFPGHGAADADSHKDLPVVNADYQTIMTRELVPFRTAVGFGVNMVMTAHCVYKDLDPNYPATLSEPVIRGILRKDIGFDGVIVSDDLEMKAVADRYTLQQTMESGVKAGVDLFMYCSEPELAVQGARVLADLYGDDGMLLRLNDSFNRMRVVHDWIRDHSGRRAKWLEQDFGALVRTNATRMEQIRDKNGQK